LAGDLEVERAVAKTIAGIYGDATVEIAETLARRIGAGIDTPGWAEAKAADLVAVQRETLQVVARLDAGTAETVDEAVAQARAAGDLAARAELAAAGEGVTGLAPLTRTDAVSALARETVVAVEQANRAILRTITDVYRTTVAETVGLSVSGTTTRRAAAQAALDRFAMRGVTGFVDRSGRAWQIESYAEMATRTATQRAYIAGKTDRYLERGRDLVVVSDSPQECPTCRPWEGQVLSLSGSRSGDVLDDGTRVAGSVSFATSAGLFHPNCTHTVGLYVPGLTRVRPVEADANPEGYAARERQREIERNIRAWKRREAVALSPEAGAVASARVSAWQAEMRGHLDGNPELFRQRQRERVGTAR
jgi:transcription elongation GreA/GreB family factor